MSKQMSLKDVAAFLQKALERLPESLSKRAMVDVAKLREYLVENRPPRIAFVARRGAGKSSLVNAILGRDAAKVGAVLAEMPSPNWHEYRRSGAALDILDTRGLGDHTCPNGDERTEALDQTLAACKGKEPDAILFLCKAKEVDANIDEDIDGVGKLLSALEEHMMCKPPVLAVATQVDELDPIVVCSPPYSDDEKQANISLAVKALEGVFEAKGIDLCHSLALSAYAQYDGDKITHSRVWNVDKLVEYLTDVLPRCAQIQMARMSRTRSVQRKLARDIVKATALICAGIAATPIPLADAIPITAAQVGMITAIGYVAGRELDAKTAAEFLTVVGGNVGVSWVLRKIAGALAKVVFPGAGSAISAGIALAATYGIGEAAIAYFIDGKSAEEVKRINERVREEKQEQGEDGVDGSVQSGELETE